MREKLIESLIAQGLTESTATLFSQVLLLFILVLLAYFANMIAKRVILRVVKALIKRSRVTWDDVFLRRRVFDNLSHIVPSLVLYVLAPIFFSSQGGLVPTIQSIATVYMIIVMLMVIDSLINALQEVYRSFDISNRLPIRGYLQVVKIIANFLGIVFVIATLTGRSPWGLIGSLGALTAVLMLVFKDVILGFVASVQLSSNNMVRRGDWIEMPQYGADGDVLDVSLATVKVQNWDKTISTIPTYALVSGSFKNWRGMTESGGRRIKRSVQIDMNSVRFCDEAMIERFQKIECLKDYMTEKTQAVSEYNQSHGIDDSVRINGRRLTNIGTFRAYIVAYLRQHPKIHQDGMTFLVRQLAPGPEGLPIEIYVFSNDQAWVAFEDIQGDIFDHILASLTEFDLRVFQNPTGADFQGLGGSQ